MGAPRALNRVGDRGRCHPGAVRPTVVTNTWNGRGALEQVAGVLTQTSGGAGAGGGGERCGERANGQEVEELGGMMAYADQVATKRSRRRGGRPRTALAAGAAVLVAIGVTAAAYVATRPSSSHVGLVVRTGQEA